MTEQQLKIISKARFSRPEIKKFSSPASVKNKHAAGEVTPARRRGLWRF
ncbi:hypothetical protein WJE63_005353 [Klebsiella pneumoniae]